MSQLDASNKRSWIAHYWAAGLWLGVGVFYGFGGMLPDTYAMRHMSMNPGYPWGAVLGLWALAAVEISVLVSILRPFPYRHSLGRLIVACILWWPWSIASLGAVLHQPPVVGFHAMWVLLVSGLLLVALLVNIVQIILARRQLQ